MATTEVAFLRPELITARREEFGLSLEELAEKVMEEAKVKVSDEGIRSIEIGRTKSPGIVVLLGIAQALEVNLSYFLSNESLEVSEVEIRQTSPSELNVKFPRGATINKSDLRNLQKRLAVEFDIIRERQEKNIREP